MNSVHVPDGTLGVSEPTFLVPRFRPDPPPPPHTHTHTLPLHPTSVFADAMGTAKKPDHEKCVLLIFGKLPGTRGPTFRVRCAHTHNK